MPPKGVGTGFGGVKYYNVERKRTDEDDWELISSAARTEITLKDQEPGVEWQYQVTAVNRKGEGKGSDVVAVPRMPAEGAD